MMGSGSLTLEDADSSGEVVDATGSLESGSENGGGGNEIVSESVVQVALISAWQRQSCCLFLSLSPSHHNVEPLSLDRGCKRCVVE